MPLADPFQLANISQTTQPPLAVVIVGLFTGSRRKSHHATTSTRESHFGLSNVLLCYNQFVPRSLLAFALAVCVTPRIFAQCPSVGVGSETEVRTLQGRLIFHDEIQEWFELKLDQPQCGEASIELLEQDSNSLAILRGCRVQSHGPLIFSARGNIRQIVKRIALVGKCVRQAPFPDFSTVKPDSAIREYRVEMHVNGGHPIHFSVSQAGKALRPWQAYASYLLTGGYLLYGLCADGFIVDKVFGTPQANPAHYPGAQVPGDMAGFDLDGAARLGKKDLDVGFTCVRP